MANCSGLPGTNGFPKNSGFSVFKLGKSPANGKVEKYASGTHWQDGLCNLWDPVKNDENMDPVFNFIKNYKMMALK